jgi:hypothetical protein
MFRSCRLVQKADTALFHRPGSYCSERGTGGGPLTVADYGLTVDGVGLATGPAGIDAAKIAPTARAWASAPGETRAAQGGRSMTAVASAPADGPPPTDQPVNAVNAMLDKLNFDFIRDTATDRGLVSLPQLPAVASG